MSSSAEKPEKIKQQNAPRRSSLKGSKPIDPNNLLKIKKGVRHSVSFGQSNTFQFKAMKAMFEESHDAAKPKKITTEEHNKFVESRKKSIKDEFSIVKEMMKNNKNIMEELDDSDEEVKKNTDKNVKIGHEALNEDNSSESSNSSDNENNIKE
mgnify:FL=1